MSNESKYMSSKTNILDLTYKLENLLTTLHKNNRRLNHSTTSV
ncbi:MAG: hypothetical protein OXC46_03740 [Thaumarchaeota archaeon]|nr:hypothetical protein [Nitrososphaerota archaeon]